MSHTQRFFHMTLGTVIGVVSTLVALGRLPLWAYLAMLAVVGGLYIAELLKNTGCEQGEL